MSVGTLVFIGVVIIQLAVIFGFILLERRQPAATLAWILAVLFIPVLGVVLYLVLGLRRTIKRSRAAEKIAKRTDEVFRRHAAVVHAAEGGRALAPWVEPTISLGTRVDQSPASQGNAVAILHNASATYDAMLAAIEAAEHHIHVQFYIIQPDETGRKLRDLLARRAEEGVEVRVLCDAIGSLRLPSEFWRPLEEAGGSAAYFAPVRIAPRFRRRDRINFRNHRKNVVVDGRVGLTGGINVGREYLGLDPDIGAWRDSHIHLEGPSVIGLQQTFVEDWLTTTGELLDDARYFPAPEAEPAGDAVVQIVASGPDRPWSLIHRIYALAIAQARERVWISSPYFVPDRVMQSAIVTAALSGVDTRLLVPKRSDSRLVSWASRSYYGELLDAGVRIYEYRRGFLHAKSMVIDSWLGTIGSANMDIRSFHLNYELNAFVYDDRFAAELAAQFEQDLKDAAELPPDWAQKLSYGRRLLHAFAGLMSPLL
ncbi:MAG: cardiolipin synthase [Deltaproteobacteria bacterium]|nr:MAG: cardiolipin synthase [Deltaproteobacteria bacterium]